MYNLIIIIRQPPDNGCLDLPAVKRFCQCFPIICYDQEAPCGSQLVGIEPVVLANLYSLLKDGYLLHIHGYPGRGFFRQIPQGCQNAAIPDLTDGGRATGPCYAYLLPCEYLLSVRQYLVKECRREPLS